MAFRSVPKIAFFRYFGMIIMWYLQYHLTWETLCHSLMTASFLLNLPVHVGETGAHFTLERQSLFESRRHKRRFTGGN
jgi:hypothetical protein